MEQVIKEAIKSHKLLSFTYKDEHRVVEPFTFGVSTRGNDSLSAYQVDGESSSSDEVGWKFFTMEKIENLQLLESTFSPLREGYNPNDSRMVEIYVTA